MKRAALYLRALLVLVAPASGAVLRAEDEASEFLSLVSVVRAAVDEWHSRVEFACTFRARQSYAVSETAAFAGELDDQLAKGNAWTATGEFYKLGSLIRFRLDYGSKPIQAPPPDHLPAGIVGGDRLVTRVSFDEVRNSEVMATYEFPHGEDDPTNRLRFKAVTEIDPQRLRPYWAGASSRAELQPLNPLRGAKGHLIGLRDFGDADHGESVSVGRTNDRVRIHFSRQSEGYLQERSITVWMGADPPVIEDIVERCSARDGSFNLQQHVKLSDFVPCTNGMVARNVVAIKHVGEGLVQVREWKSDDLGERDPDSRDFILITRANTLVHGLRSPPRPSNGRKLFDMNKLNASGVASQHTAGPPDVPAVTQLAPRELPVAPRLSWVIGLNVAMATAFAVYLAWRWRRARRKSAQR